MTQRLPHNSLAVLRSAIPIEHRKTISIQLLSDYIHERKRPGIERSYVLEKACKKIGLNVIASDWVYSPKKIKQALINQASPKDAA